MAVSTLDEVQDKLDLIFRLLTNRTRVWSLDEAQEILGLSRASLYREIAEKKIHTRARRRRSYIERAEIIRYNEGADPLAEIILFPERLYHQGNRREARPGATQRAGAKHSAGQTERA
jgi:hypothetical protein